MIVNTVLKILEHEELTSTQKQILIVLTAVPTVAADGISYSDISFYTSLSQKSVISNLKFLEYMGMLEVTRNDTQQNKYNLKLLVDV